MGPWKAAQVERDIENVRVGINDPKSYYDSPEYATLIGEDKGVFFKTRGILPAPEVVGWHRGEMAYTVCKHTHGTCTRCGEPSAAQFMTNSLSILLCESCCKGMQVTVPAKFSSMPRGRTPFRRIAAIPNVSGHPNKCLTKGCNTLSKHTVDIRKVRFDFCGECYRA